MSTEDYIRATSTDLTTEESVKPSADMVTITQSSVCSSQPLSVYLKTAPDLPSPVNFSRPTTPESFKNNFRNGGGETDFEIDFDMSASAASNAAPPSSYVSAGENPPARYVAQLAKNGITEITVMGSKEKKDFSRLDLAFDLSHLTEEVRSTCVRVVSACLLTSTDWQAFKGASDKALASPKSGAAYARILQILVDTAEDQTKKIFTSEWNFHLRMHYINSLLLQPDLVGTDKIECTTYLGDGDAIWNYAPQCFTHFTDLSQPKVDSVFYICRDQAEYDPGSTLYTICERVVKQEYFHVPLANAPAKFTGPELSEMAKLLSKKTLDKLNSYKETAAVSIGSSHQQADMLIH